MKRIFPFFLVCNIYLTCWAIITDGYCQSSSTIRGTVKSIKTVPVLNPEITILRQEDDGKIIEKKFTAFFSQNDTGCVDWNTPENHSKALVFSLLPGNVVEISYVLKNGHQEIKTISLLSFSSETLFPGYEKVKHGQLLKDLQATVPRKSVIILLKGHEKLTDRMKRPEERNSALRQIQALQNKVLESIPKSAFTPGLILTNIPVISGDATLEGIRILAANPLVDTIEADMPMELHGDDVPSMQMEGEK